jgi:hypothetical protein
MIAILTDVTASRDFALSLECALIVLSRCIVAINRLEARTVEERTARSESADTLASLRIEIQRRLSEQMDQERQFFKLSMELI